MNKHLKKPILQDNVPIISARDVLMINLTSKLSIMEIELRKNGLEYASTLLRAAAFSITKDLNS